jgi:hypothetical protein
MTKQYMTGMLEISVLQKKIDIYVDNDNNHNTITIKRNRSDNEETPTTN